MSLPYENASAGNAALNDVEKILQRFGCTKFGTMRDYPSGKLLLQFEWRDRRVSLEVSFKGYAAAWLKEHPYTDRMKKTQDQHKAEALQRGEKAAPSILRDWVKAQVTAVEVGLFQFEHLFMPHMLTQDGRRAIDAVAPLLAKIEQQQIEGPTPQLSER